MFFRSVIALILSGLSLTAADRSKAIKIGDKARNSHSLRDLRGNRRSLYSFDKRRAIVLAFLGAKCPVSSAYIPALVKLEQQLRKRKTQFLAIYPNEHESLDDIAIHASDRNIPFPILKDVGQKLADQLGVTRVPTVVVLDETFHLHYRGRIDDRIGVGYRREKATRLDLSIAIDEVLDGKKVTVTETEADGCLLDRANKLPPRTDITYAKQISRILQNRCQNCHRPGQAAPFSLLTYKDAVSHASMIKEVTRQKRMPPWHADPRYGHFANDRSMPEKEIDALAAWVDSGMPFGKEKDLPKEKSWPKGWLLGKPDLVIDMPKPFEVPAEGALPYKYYTVQTNFDEDKWVQMAEARPGTAEVVHHVVAYILKPGQRRPFGVDGSMSVLVGWAPGDLPLICPPGTALRIPKGSRILFELHYTPVGKKMSDRSSIGLTFAKQKPKREIFINAFANESIELPPRDPHYEAEATLRLRADARIISLTPHMHWRGKDYRYEAIYPNGKKEVLLNVPRWDFNWQSVYVFKDPVKLPKGTRIHSIAHWDNSKNNPYNPDPGKRVNFGLQTWDEMMVGWVTYVWEIPGTAEKLAKQPVDRMELMFQRFDRNGNDIIEAKEIPGRMATLLQFSGVKIPEKMDRKAFKAFYEEMMKRFRRSRSSGQDSGKK